MNLEMRNDKIEKIETAQHISQLTYRSLHPSYVYKKNDIPKEKKTHYSLIQLHTNLGSMFKSLNKFFQMAFLNYQATINL